MISIPTFNQGSPLWSAKKLGQSDATMRGQGCFTCTAASMLSNYGHSVDPGQLCDQLNAANGYDAEGLLEWSVLEKLYPDCVLADSFNTTLMPTSGSHVLMPVALKRIARAVRLGMPVGICVWVKGGAPLKPNHIITLKHAPDDLQGWLANDSDGGYEVKLEANGKYGTPEQAIYGARILVGAPTSFPDYSTQGDMGDGVATFKAAQVMRGRNVQTYSKEIVQALLGA